MDRKANAVFLSVVIMNSDQLFEMLGKDEEAFRSKLIPWFRGAKGEELHEAVVKMYNFCLELSQIEEMCENIMVAAKGSAAMDSIASEYEMGNLRDRWLRRLLNQSSESESSDADGAEKAVQGFVTLPVFFATNRAILGGHVRRFYGTSRADKVSYGCAWISLPDSHRYGDVDSSTWRYSAKRVGVPRSKMVHLSTVPLAEEKCVLKLRKLMHAMGEKEAIVFVHGYNTTLANGCQRLAQIAYTGNFRGPSFLFSWPSNQSLAAYTADEGNVMWAIQDFIRTLKLLLTGLGMEKIHLLGHSMGSRAIIYTLLRLFPGARPKGSAAIGRVVLAAPDFDLGEFSHLVPDLAERCERITLYCSSDDQALHLSRSVHGGYPRLGDFRGFLEAVSDPRIGEAMGKHVDITDTTGTDSSWLRHAYVFTTCGIIMDCCMVLRGGLSPMERGGLVARTLPYGGTYYAFITGQNGGSCYDPRKLFSFGKLFSVRSTGSGKLKIVSRPEGGAAAEAMEPVREEPAGDKDATEEGAEEGEGLKPPDPTLRTFGKLDTIVSVGDGEIDGDEGDDLGGGNDGDGDVDEEASEQLEFGEDGSEAIVRKRDRVVAESSVVVEGVYGEPGVVRSQVHESGKVQVTFVGPHGHQDLLEGLEPPEDAETINVQPDSPSAVGGHDLGGDGRPPGGRQRKAPLSARDKEKRAAVSRTLSLGGSRLSGRAPPIDRTLSTNRRYLRGHLFGGSRRHDKGMLGHEGGPRTPEEAEAAAEAVQAPVNEFVRSAPPSERVGGG